jgi:uncharacterized membrane protein YtjA (UPF0391 family)
MEAEQSQRFLRFVGLSGVETTLAKVLFIHE